MHRFIFTYILIAGERTSGICHIKKYMSFIKGCKSGREEKEMLSLKPILQADRNWSLAKCAIQYMVERRITNLNSIFVTIPVYFNSHVF